MRASCNADGVQNCRHDCSAHAIGCQSSKPVPAAMSVRTDTASHQAVAVVRSLDRATRAPCDTRHAKSTSTTVLPSYRSPIAAFASTQADQSVDLERGDRRHRGRHSLPQVANCWSTWPRRLLAGGVDVMEVTFTVPRAHRVLEQVAERLGRQDPAGCRHGAGSRDGPHRASRPGPSSSSRRRSIWT